MKFRPSFKAKSRSHNRPLGGKPERTHSNRPKTARDTKRPAGPSPIPKQDPYAFPMRINKFLALNGYATRRGADELVSRGRVTINGTLARLGDHVEKSDKVEVQSRAVRGATRGSPIESFHYFAYNKPRGMSTERTRKSRGIMQISPLAQSQHAQRLFPLTGLDQQAEGLVILTDDRRLIARIQEPSHPHMKEYLIHTRVPFRSTFKEKAEAGIVLAGGGTISATADMHSPTACVLRTSDNGGHIRELCSTLFAEVDSLKRIAILNVRLGGLAENCYRPIEGDELADFLGQLGLGQNI